MKYVRTTLEWLVFILGLSLMINGIPLLFEEYWWGFGLFSIGYGFWSVAPNTCWKWYFKYLTDENVQS